MKKVSLVVYHNYIEDIIKKIHELELFQIINISKEEPEFLDDTEKASAFPDSEICANYVLRLSRIIDILNQIDPKPSGIKTMLKPPIQEIKTIEDSTLDEINSYAEGLLGNIEKNILTYEQKLKKLEERKGEINQNIEKIKYFKDFDFDLDHIGLSQYLIIKAGITLDYDKVITKIKDIENAGIISKQFVKGKEKEYAVLIFAYISEKEKIEKIFRQHITELDFDGISGPSKNVLNLYKKEIDEMEKEKKHINKELKKYAKSQLNDLLATREVIQLEGIRKDVSKNFSKTNNTYIIKGWILEKNEEKFKEILETSSDQCIIYESEKPSMNPDNPPTHIETPRWADGFKGLLTMFATPRYNEINPTIIMGFFFILFFGVMLGDAGYGLIIFVLSLYGYFILGKHTDMFRSWSFMGIWMGMVTITVGLLTNSFFGDLIPRFFYGDPEATIYSLQIAGIQLPANSIKDPITILVIALIFGLIHLNVGVLLGIIQSFKEKQFKEMLTSKTCWIPLQLGGGILIGSSILDFQFADIFITIAAALVVIGLIQLMINAGPIGFFEITGYVGDWLSYARLLALGLATAGMALAFNVVAQLLGEMIPFIGIVIMIILLVFAHVINLGLQALGAGIHSLRLQYVEFFNRFYQGGGHEFTPFKINRKYTEIKDDKIE
jgi:V/A-type H+-transporting ATPase subunit I